MSYDKTVAAARETPIGDESHLVPEPAPHDGGGRTQHLAHSGPTYRPLVPDDDDVTGANRTVQDRLRRAFLAFEDPRATAERQPFLARDLCDRSVRCHIPVQDHEVAVLLQWIGERSHDVLSSKIHACICEVFRQRV